jgi:hypothetical protein
MREAKAAGPARALECVGNGAPPVEDGSPAKQAREKQARESQARYQGEHQGAECYQGGSTKRGKGARVPSQQKRQGGPASAPGRRTQEREPRTRRETTRAHQGEPYPYQGERTREPSRYQGEPGPPRSGVLGYRVILSTRRAPEPLDAGALAREASTRT